MRPLGRTLDPAPTEGADDASQARSNAAAAADPRSDFLLALSGEIASGLGGILAVAELLESQPLGGDAPAYVRTLSDCGRTLLRLVSDAADLARAEAGGLELAPEPVTLRDLVDAVQTRWTPRALEDGVAIGAVFEGEAGLAADLDPARLHQVFDALIEHALKLTRRGGVEAGLSAVREGGRIRLRGHVRDTGPGFPPDRLAGVFDPFSRDARTAYGTGLGLAVARGLVTVMGGRIWAENNPGAGSTVRFEFDAPASATSSDAPHDCPVEERPPLQGHVLIVDDNATNRTVAKMLVEMFGCTCETADDGAHAVPIVAQGRFDAVLMDIRMPLMDGVAATRAIRDAGGPASRVPIVALTANADPEDARGYMAAGMASVVEKPIKAERLLLALAEVLGDSAERRGLHRARAAA